MFKSLGNVCVGLAALSLLASPALAQDRSKIQGYVPELSHGRVPEAIASDPANTLTFTLDNGGIIDVQLRPDAAPLHVHRIQTLAAEGFYDGQVFHRVIPGFMAQGGDPLGNGTGGSDLPDLPAEFSTLPHLRGVFAMARSEDENSANSQFFIMLSPNFALDEKYTVVGRVKRGMNTVDTIAPGEPPVAPTRIVSARIGGPVPAAPATKEAASRADELPEG
ncbi:peptidylprolyl isomerase [Sphingomicrobium astaxanthinifaciens]|uniref:peptidylprolyl isomerase n=1 Tax=Sphingomicrobium astaxanthinifaciens TaxID=1227949 RepID=UPI001FCA62D0|nr:peptidylprolyl isomerase [Sphingomicrobium astaxanthinifaciens]MCJ7420602.1 peptidylprolyl isomerase [Sphingomicrobium astaxanthinifaciens]